jgi:clathrin heavy chain
VERQSPELWATVLTPENDHRRAVIDQVVGTALPESTNADELSTTCRAFITAELPNELIELLEKIVLHNSDFSKEKNLQNLLILTAIKSDKSRVMDYINRLDNYDGETIAKVALGHPYNLYEEAFLIYKKCNLTSEAMDVLLLNIVDLERAQEFAARINEAKVWYKLGKAQLLQNSIPEAIDSYLKAEDPADYEEVIEKAEREEAYSELIGFLLMARKTVKSQLIDGELVYSYAKTEQIADMEEFVSNTNSANLQAIGDRLYDERAYKAAKILYGAIPNNARLASCHVQLGEYSLAVDIAKKANNAKTWKEVNVACVQAEQFRLAQVAGMHIIVHADHLEEVIAVYEKLGHFEELMSLLDSGLANERAHVGMFTELGVLYAKYKPEKLTDFIKLNTQKLNIPKLIQACERHNLWEQVVFLYTPYDEFDSAATAMMNHSPAAFSHDQFQMIMSKVSNFEIYYKAIQFYLEEQPIQVNSLLNTIALKVDHARVVNHVRKTGHLALILPYLKQVQQHNIAAVNDAINELYVESEQYDEMRQSIEDFDNFDQIALAQKMEKHELAEMRRIASLVYKKNKRYKQSIELSKVDKMFKDAMETARDSSNPELVESLLRYFVENNDAECFCACLYTCYDYVRPDVALELAWRNGLLDYAMPYLIETFREYTSRLDALDKKTTKKEEEEEKNKSASNDYVADYMPPMMGMPGMMGGPLALTGGPVPQQPNMMGGMPGMMGGQPNMMGGNPSMMMTPGRF